MPFLLKDFERLCSCKVDVIAVGSGQALRLASNGDVDMVLVHDPPAEQNFIREGFESTGKPSWSTISSFWDPHRIPRASSA